jgi:hypothetical protein
VQDHRAFETGKSALTFFPFTIVWVTRIWTGYRLQ